MIMTKRKTHGIRLLALAKIYCRCGWTYMPDKINGVAEHELVNQLEAAHEEHVREMTAKR